MATDTGKRWTRFEHPLAFWLGAGACTAGVLLHLPMYVQARGMGYRMAGMRPDGEMIVGMALIAAGLGGALYGLLPRRAREIKRAASGIRVRPLDDAPIRPSHVAMLLVISIAVVIDVMKPAALSFVAPGMAKEYDLQSVTNPHGYLPVALLPLCGISGTVIGSFFWGWLGDWFGRRSSIIYAGLLFVSTSICGAMPGFTWNLLMCFLMGVGAGGMLPITFALLAETIPARHRGWIMVAIGGGVAGAGYMLTSWLAETLTPHYSWRILWLIGLPTGVLLIMLSRWIPESPRFLLATGQRDEAIKVIAEFGAEVQEDGSRDSAAGGKFPIQIGARVSPSRPSQYSSIATCVLALGVGLVAYGFQLWIPTNLEHLGLTAVSSDYVIRNATAIGLPVSIIAAVLYGFWSSRKTVIVFFSVLALALIGFVVAGDSVVQDRSVLTALLVIPESQATLTAALVMVYASEVYPTIIRSRGSGMVAGITKAGGVAIIGMSVSTATTPSIGVTAATGAVPLVIGIIVFFVTARETGKMRLEELEPRSYPDPSQPVA